MWTDDAGIPHSILQAEGGEQWDIPPRYLGGGVGAVLIGNFPIPTGSENFLLGGGVWGL